MKTKNNIEVSVIIPNYNYGRYLNQCITSVLESEFEDNAIEIIIVDDASTDNSINVIENFLNNTKASIHLIKQKTNLGLAKARNTGIKKALGNYLFFLDSDNYIGKSCLKTHFDVLSKNIEYTACYAPIQKFDDRSDRVLTIFSNQEYDYDKLKYGNYIDAMAMIKRKDLLEIGLYDEGMPYTGWEDYELWLRIGSKNKKIFFIDGKPLSYYRIHEDSMIHNMQSSGVGTLITYVSEKYHFNTLQKNEELSNTNIQIFWASVEGAFSENYSSSQLISLKDSSTTLKFQISPFSETIEFIRFDLGDNVGFINIHSIIIKDSFQKIKWTWDKCTLYAQQNLLLLDNKNLWPDKTLQISIAIDPSFIIATNEVIKELSSSNFFIEITLSSPDSHQLNFLKTPVKPFTCFSNNEFTLLEEQVSKLNIEKKGLLTELNELQLMSIVKNEKNNDLIKQNIKIEEKFNTLSDSLSENLNQKQELIASINLHLTYIERLGEEKKQIIEKHAILLDQISSMKSDKQQLEIRLNDYNKKNQESELMITQLKEDILRLKNQSFISFIKGKVNNKRKD